MASFRIIAALMVVSGACLLVAAPPATAQSLRPMQAGPVTGANPGFARCPKSADQYAAVMKQLVGSAARARALADENPLLEPDAAFYEAELAATKQCAATLAALMTH